jgi:hypothetical protein
MLRFFGSIRGAAPYAHDLLGSGSPNLFGRITIGYPPRSRNRTIP